jgi:hypothetical protein
MKGMMSLMWQSRRRFMTLVNDVYELGWEDIEPVECPMAEGDLMPQEVFEAEVLYFLGKK